MREKSGEGVTFRWGEALHGPEGDPSAVNLIPIISGRKLV